ncbi:hypothetical protein K3757_02795 [Sulfitobacter sp. S223]|uniref:hypothetical protein n=1 Tax=Sulfitobacter sp. S223 TaxID=2867023 RepID=UPI0021A5773F|nr:hypothetical protein [Sulfitobacter sp. S223]UWR26879.1 hypothetical protein K3757_02795 [Sulfitobacter sp. S223]
MTLIKMQTGDRFVANSAEIFQRYGVTLELGYDFEEYRKILKSARPDHELGAPYDPRLREMNANNALWIVGRNVAGDVIHTQALRMLDNHSLSVGEYFSRRFREFPPSVPALDLERSRFRAGPGAMRMFGSVAYHGEFWIAPGAESLRGQGMSCVLGRYGFYEAIQHWDPDHVVAFMAKGIAFKGLAERTGWMHTQPGALRWFLQGNDVPIEGFMAYMDREDLHYVLELPLNDLVAMAA